MIVGETEERSELDRVRAAYGRRLSHIPSDRYARTSSSQLFLLHEREYALIALLRSAGIHTLAGQRLLDVGCGAGATLRQLLEYGAEPHMLAGLDLLPEKVNQARLLAPHLKVVCASASQMPFPGASFDFVFQFLVFTSILSRAVRNKIASEITRVLVPGGILIWYDFAIDNPRNPDVKRVKRSEIRQLFPGFKMTARRVTVAPPLGRLLARFGPAAYHLAGQLRFTSTHNLCLLRKT